MAVNLNGAADLAGFSPKRTSRAMVPLVVAIVGALAIIASWRGLSTWLSRASGLGRPCDGLPSPSCRKSWAAAGAPC